MNKIQLEMDFLDFFAKHLKYFDEAVRARESIKIAGKTASITDLMSLSLFTNEGQLDPSLFEKYKIILDDKRVLSAMQSLQLSDISLREKIIFDGAIASATHDLFSKYAEELSDLLLKMDECCEDYAVTKQEEHKEWQTAYLESHAALKNTPKIVLSKLGTAYLRLEKNPDPLSPLSVSHYLFKHIKQYRSELCALPPTDELTLYQKLKRYLDELQDEVTALNSPELTPPSIFSPIRFFGSLASYYLDELTTKIKKRDFFEAILAHFDSDAASDKSLKKSYEHVLAEQPDLLASVTSGWLSQRAAHLLAELQEAPALKLCV